MTKSLEKNNSFFSHGKLMLTGEYLALLGAKVLALATTVGQSMEIEENESGTISWQSFDDKNVCWFSASFGLDNFEILEYSDPGRVNFIRSLFVELKKMNPDFLNSCKGISLKTNLGFDREWGLGSSSTLINNLAVWAEVDPYLLLEKTLGGSGYDIAVAMAGDHVFYQNQPKPQGTKISFDPDFKENIFFVYLNKKQNSAVEVSKFLVDEKDYTEEIERISNLTEKIARANGLQEFEACIDEHNAIMSNVLRRPSAQDYFEDYTGGMIKYLGAWGGDFILVTGHRQNMTYFMNRGLTTILTYEDIIKKTT